MQLHNVLRVEIEESRPHDTYCFRRIIIHTDKGNVQIELYSRFASDDSETPVISIGV
jgi:hypothetical protein